MELRVELRVEHSFSSPRHHRCRRVHHRVVPESGTPGTLAAEGALVAAELPVSMRLQWQRATERTRTRGHGTDGNVNVNNLLAISDSDFDNSGEAGSQAEAVNHLETPLRQLLVTHRASSCDKRGGHVQLC